MVGEHHLLNENKYKVRKEALLYVKWIIYMTCTKEDDRSQGKEISHDVFKQVQ